METDDEHLALAGAEHQEDPAQIEHFLHCHGQKPQVVFGASAETLREIFVRLEIVDNGVDETFVFVGECEEALSESPNVEDGADDHAPVDIDLTVEVLEIHRHRHVHRHGCRHVAVDVNFAGSDKHRRFSPATTVGVVTQWARRKFPDVDPAAVADFVLEITDTKTQPRVDEHLGELVAPAKCSISFKLVKEITPQGEADAEA
jgi:hypothetical protein